MLRGFVLLSGLIAASAAAEDAVRQEHWTIYSENYEAPDGSRNTDLGAVSNIGVLVGLQLERAKGANDALRPDDLHVGASVAQAPCLRLRTRDLAYFAEMVSVAPLQTATLENKGYVSKFPDKLADYKIRDVLALSVESEDCEAPFGGAVVPVSFSAEPDTLVIYLSVPEGDLQVYIGDKDDGARKRIKCAQRFTRISDHTCRARLADLNSGQRSLEIEIRAGDVFDKLDWDLVLP